MRHIKELFVALFALIQLSTGSPTCSYGARGSLTSTCVEATPSYFRTTSYRFDNLDETVRCVNCNLQTLDGNTFDISGNQIKNLDLSASRIETLKPKAFIGLVFLRKLLMPNNKIGAIPAETFQGVNRIRVLDLENNTVASLVTNGFKELSNLEQLNLKNNKIKTIEVGAFIGLGSLEDLDLSNNEIESVKDIFKGLDSVKVINLEGNNIGQINPNDIQGLEDLLQFNLARNKLTKIPADVFLALQHLENLNLSSNPISTVEVGVFRGLYSLEDLDLSHCNVSGFERKVLQLRLLRNLNLAYNKFITFQTGWFSGLPELRTLNVSHNQIKTYQKTGVIALHSLHSLDLSSNQMTYLDFERMIQHLPSLAFLELEDNPWLCYMGVEMEKYFQNDNLHFNLGKQFEDPNLKCNDSKKDIPKEDPTNGASPRTELLVADSSGHEYVLYIFICISMALMSFLFYLQYRTQKDIKDILGKKNVAEVQLLSSCDLEARDDYS